MLVDDHAVVRSGLSAFLLAFDDLELVGDAADGVRASTCQPCCPDVVLMDLGCRAWTGLLLARHRESS